MVALKQALKRSGLILEFEDDGVNLDVKLDPKIENMRRRGPDHRCRRCLGRGRRRRRGT